MSQEEVFNFLKMQRLTGNHKYWRKFEIRKELIKSGVINCNKGLGLIGRQVNKLYAHDFLDIELSEEKFFVQKYRLKEKYLMIDSPDEISPFFKE